jgi:hypothetical protein
MPHWWTRLTAEERESHMAKWPRQTVRDFMDLADAKVASGIERTKAEQEAFEQLLKEMYPDKARDEQPPPPKPPREVP